MVSGVKELRDVSMEGDGVHTTSTSAVLCSNEEDLLPTIYVILPMVVDETKSASASTSPNIRQVISAGSWKRRWCVCVWNVYSDIMVCVCLLTLFVYTVP